MDHSVLNKLNILNYKQTLLECTLILVHEVDKIFNVSSCIQYTHLMRNIYAPWHVPVSPTSCS